MKNIIKSLCVATLAIVSFGCTNLDETVYSDIKKDDFLKNEKLLRVYAARAYTKLQAWGSEQSIWTLNIQTSDECAAPKNCVNDWVDPRYKELQTHAFTISNKLVRMGWDYCFDGIAACNDVLYEVQRSPYEFEGKKTVLAEMKLLRAFYYFLAVDGWANVPLSVDKNTEYPEQIGRDSMFLFLEREILDNVGLLDAKPTTKNYGRVTQGMAYTMLAKLYLMSEKWTGKERWADAEKACDSVMLKGNYIIESDFKSNFAVKNEGSGENIFVIPYSTIYTESDHNDFVIFIMTLCPEHSKSFNIPAASWDGLVCQPDFFATFDDADTRRSDTFLYGQQYDRSGKAIDGFVLKPDFSDALYSTGKGAYDGARFGKYEYQTDGLLKSDQTSMDNDFAVFRYADVVLMWAESLIRQGRAGEAVNNADLQKIRTRAGLSPMTAADLTLDGILLERGHELAWEGWRRQDLIRFGHYNDAWWAKPSKSATYTEIYPIPRERLGSNKNLKQNPVYVK